MTPRLIRGLATSTIRVPGLVTLNPLGCSWSGDTALRLWHYKGDEDPAGRILDIYPSPTGITILADVERTPAGNTAWVGIRRGELMGLSVSARYIRGSERSRDGRLWIDCWSLEEVSVCRRARDPACRLSMIPDCDPVFERIARSRGAQ